MTLTRDQVMDKVLSSPFMGRWRVAPEGLLNLPLPIGERVGVRGETLPLPLGERVGVRGLIWQ